MLKYKLNLFKIKAHLLLNNKIMFNLINKIVLLIPVILIKKMILNLINSSRIFNSKFISNSKFKYLI